MYCGSPGLVVLNSENLRSENISTGYLYIQGVTNLQTFRYSSDYHRFAAGPAGRFFQHRTSQLTGWRRCLPDQQDAERDMCQAGLLPVALETFRFCLFYLTEDVQSFKGCLCLT
ncbi:hypothetical protein AMECASPLE_029831 [Ameca splendens]|uniref:Uncharacterized protein n=1 Tax=Ameca splendens TaxID=208324 RepID=A0ABV1ADL0_9TELE